MLTIKLLQSFSRCSHLENFDCPKIKFTCVINRKISTSTGNISRFAGAVRIIFSLMTIYVPSALSASGKYIHVILYTQLDKNKYLGSLPKGKMWYLLTIPVNISIILPYSDKRKQLLKITFLVNEQNTCVCHVHLYIDINAISGCLDLNIFQQDECFCSKLGLEVEYKSNDLYITLTYCYISYLFWCVCVCVCVLLLLLFNVTFILI